MEEVFEPVTENQKQNQIQIQLQSDKQIQTYVILLKLQHKQSKIRQEQYKNLVKILMKSCTAQSKKEYENMMHYLLVIIKMSPIWLILT